ncbi:MAG: type II toxin-antitoxin system VapC family toxin [Candidatus Bathyarchaeia archaeon]
MLDTSIIISILRGDKEVKGVIENLNKESLCTTTITQFELFSRIYHKGLIKEGIILKRLIKSLTLLIFDEDSSDKAAQIMSSLLKAGKPINVIDVLIAGIALANGVEDIITKDEDFKVIEEIYGYPKVILIK